ncbi:MAG: flavin reductase family protein [Bacteroidota bacterium]
MGNILSLDPQTLSVPRLHAYLLAAVAPRPICFASTINQQGQVNLSPFSFFNVFSSNPPVMIFSPARRGRDNTTKHTYENLLEVPETVINIVNYPIVEQMSLSSTEYDRGVNEFVKAGFTEVASEKVAPPRVGEAPVCFECTVDDIIELGQEGGAGNLVIARVVMIHIQEKYLDDQQKLDTTKLDLVGRMGGSWYNRASGNALFEIPKPLRTKGMGVDQLPVHIRNSHILTGNNLGRLGNLEQLPDAASIRSRLSQANVQQLVMAKNWNGLHQLAQTYLENGDAQTALELLMCQQ